MSIKVLQRVQDKNCYGLSPQGPAGLAGSSGPPSSAVERWTFNPMVVGSTPTAGACFLPCINVLCVLMYI